MLVKQNKRIEKERWKLLRQIHDLIESVMVLLGFVWLALLVIELIYGLNPFLETSAFIIWGIFILDFLLEIFIAPEKGTYLRTHWITAVSLVIPALRVFRIARAIRVLRSLRGVRSLRFIKLLTSLNRGIKSLRKEVKGRGVGYIFLLTVFVVFSGAAGILYFESPEALRESGISGVGETVIGITNYGEALWWTAMLMTSIGSEYWPKTVAGRILTFLLSLYALGVFGYITATIASFFIGKDIKR